MTDNSKRQALQQMCYGLYILGAPSGDGACTAILANWVGQVSFSPALVSVSVEYGSLMHSAINSQGKFTINVLPTGGAEIARSFLKTPTSTSGDFNGWRFHLSKLGCPILQDCLSWFECEVRQSLKCGDHTLFIGEIVDAGLHGDGVGLAMKDTGLNYWKESR